MKIKLIILINLITITLTFAQQQEITFPYQNINFSAAPRSTLSPMSIKLWDNYGNGGPSTYGTVMEIYGLSSHQTSQLYFGGWDNSKIKYREAFYAQNTWSDWITLLDSKNNVESAGLMLITGQGSHYIANGNVGIGTTTPKEKLDVNGNVIWNGYRAGNPRALSLGYSGGNYGGIGYNIDYTQASGVFSRPLNDQSSYLEFKYGGFNFYGNANPMSSNGVNLNGGGNNLNLFAIITNTGNFGIGTETPKEKLSVNGKIRAHEVKIETANWPDYVFEEGYDVGTLEKLESYVKANKHLPEVPSAKEVEANGVELGEMNKILLKKIEELTLILIEQNKRINKLEDKTNNN